MKPRHENYNVYAQLFKKDISLPCVLFPVDYTRSIASTRANWHEDLEIQLITHGEGYVIVDGEKHRVKAGDIVPINSNCVHLTATDDTMYYTAMIVNSDFLHYTDIDFTEVNFKGIIRDERIERLFSDVVAACGEKGRICKRARVQMKLLALITELRENHTDSREKKPNLDREFDTIKAAINFIREHYAEKLTLDEIATSVFTNKYYLSRNFKSITGQTVVEYINNYRCDRAKELIQSGVPVNEAATRCGFNNISFFTKTFKTITGKLPSEYKIK